MLSSCNYLTVICESLSLHIFFTMSAMRLPVAVLELDLTLFLDFFDYDRQLMDIDDDDISLRGFVSEAVRRESILPSPKMQSSSQSSLDSYDDDRMTMGSGDVPVASSKHADGYQGDDSNNECEDRRAVDDLLDEAFDTSDDYDADMDPRNVVLRQKPHQDPYYDPDMDVNNVVMRKKSNAGPVPVSMIDSAL